MTSALTITLPHQLFSNNAHCMQHGPLSVGADHEDDSCAVLPERSASHACMPCKSHSLQHERTHTQQSYVTQGAPAQRHRHADAICSVLSGPQSNYHAHHFPTKKSPGRCTQHWCMHGPCMPCSRFRQLATQAISQCPFLNCMRSRPQLCLQQPNRFKPV